MKRGAELTLLLTGVFLLGIAGWKGTRYEAFQNHPDWFVQLSGPSAPSRSILQAGAGPIRVLGRLEVPRLRMSVLIVDGDDGPRLDLGAGHVPGTAVIGTAGNSVIAGHRDTTFRALRSIRLGDQIRIQSDRLYTYSVQAVQIVNPDDVRLLENTSSPTLTLVTCYPFRFVGDAPKRFVIQAKRLTT